MASNIDDLINDTRLARLFLKDVHHCALQLWVLQIKSGQAIENRIIYGRLLPYNYSDNKWSSSNDDNFYPFGQVQAQVIRLNLYVTSLHCAVLLRQLSAGRTILEISEELNIGLSDKLKARFGTTAFAADDLAYRPVAYLLNRDAYDRHSPSSPHGGAGALSASITQTDKGALFRLCQDYDVALAESVVKHLNADTGMDFGGSDIVRFGDLELLVFPALDHHERSLLNVSWADAPSTLVARFNPMQVPYFSKFQFRLGIANDGQIVYSGIATAERDSKGVFECKFELSDHLRAMNDCTELEIFGFCDDHSREGTLCCRWRIRYIREINYQGHVRGHGASPIEFDWLKKTTRPSVSARLKEVLTINYGNQGFSKRIGGREADPWVTTNRSLKSLFARLHPPKSKGRFFLRWGKGDPDGRLQFSEWFKTVLDENQKHQIVIFDPYFEDAGLGLLLLCAAPKADYIVFRSLLKPSKASEATPCESGKSAWSGIDNLLANCEHNRRWLKQIRLRIYGLKEGRLHDRYILIMGSDKLPILGFNLSNSFQAAAQDHPLLVTQIPADILLQVEQYMSGLVQEAEAAQPEDATENLSMRLLFDSSASPMAPNKPQHFLEIARAGEVLSVWTGESALQGLSGDRLKERMTVLGLLKDDSLALPRVASLRKYIDEQAGDFTDFAANWEVLGEMLAHLPTEASCFREIESERTFLDFLVRFLKESFNRTHVEIGNGRECEVVNAWFFQASIETLLQSPNQPDLLSHTSKYAALTWSEYFTVKFLWRYIPDALLTIAETQIARVPREPQSSDVVRLSLLSQIVSEISLSVQFGISEGQRDRLVRSSNGLMQWMGLSAIETQLEKSGGLAIVQQQLMAAFTNPERVRALGWMVYHVAANSMKAVIYNGLVSALHETLPKPISAEELGHLVNSMRGHTRQLARTEPWLFQDVILPLLQNDRVKIDDACEIWVKELVVMLELQQENLPRMFDGNREGQTTNITAFLFAFSGLDRQRASLKLVQKILKRLKRILQQPLASTVNWPRYDDALIVSMWILIFARWGQYYLRERVMVVFELEALYQDASKLAMVRPIEEWRRVGSTQKELIKAFDKVKNLLASTLEITRSEPEF